MKKKVIGVILTVLIMMFAVTSFSNPITTEDELIYLYQEEKLAKDVYSELYDIYGLKTFYNISQSEQKHMDSVAYLLKSYNIDFENISNVRGIYTIPELQDLYDQLISQGSISITEALKVGATIEDLDISDLDKMLIKDYDETIKRVLNNLKSGSENHMRAFIKQLDKYNDSYTPKYISQEYFESIT